jgi:hypothetical protein
MKTLFKLLGATLLATGFCACESELPSREPGFGEKLQRGIRGQGSLYTPTPEQDASLNPPR